MLILTRTPGESLIISDNIEVTIVAVKGNQVRIGIKAPDDVNIVRDELVNDDPVTRQQGHDERY